MTNTLTLRWKENMNALSVFWGCENPCRLAVVTDSVKAVLFGPYGKVYQSFTYISWRTLVKVIELSIMVDTRWSSLLDIK